MLTFIEPDYLWLLLVLPLVWALAVLSPRTMPAWIFRGSVLLRTLGVAALVLALAGAQMMRPVNERQVVFLLDSSDSVSRSARARAEAYMQQALAAMPPDSKAGIVLFGEDARVERSPDTLQTLGKLATTPGGTRTNIEAGVQLGLSLLPTEVQRRLVLLSDGGENDGDAMLAARLAASQGVPVDVVPLSEQEQGLDAQVSGLELPSVAAEGQELRLVIHTDSASTTQAFPVAARLLVEQHNAATGGDESRTLVDQEVTLRGGAQTFETTLPPPEDTFNRYIVRLRAEGDSQAENNVAEAFTLVKGNPRILLVEGTDDAARPLSDALTAAGLAVETTTPGTMPATLTTLLPYDAVVLVDVPKRAVPERTIAALAPYVRDLGRGLAMVGGPQSFGAGGWRETPVEEALPVYMDIRTETLRQPPVSIVVVIDVSGSMGAKEGEYTKVQLAAEGAIRIAMQLRDEDEITVIPFDSQAQNVVGPLPGTQRDQAIDRIAGIRAGGGGINAYDALQAAALVVRSSDKPIRHIITITDGSDTVQQEGAHDLVDTLRAEGVTVSSVAVGDGSDVPFIERMVERGEGRFFLVEQASEIPDIMTSEANAMIQPFVREGEFQPVRVLMHPVMREIAAMPPLYGYVATTPKDSASVILQTDRGDPLLAVWQYGLGHSLAWTPDLRGQWGREVVRWPDYQRLVTQMGVWLLPTADAQHMTLETQTINHQLVLVARVQTETGSPAAGMRVAGQMVSTEGAAIDVVLHEVLPGEYRLSVPDLPPGVYLLHVLASDGAGTPYASVTAGAAVPFSGEYRRQGDNPALLATLADTTGGRHNPAPAAVYDDPGQRTGLVRSIAFPLLWVALVLLPFDIAVRRLLGRFSRKPSTRAKAPRKHPKAPPPSADPAPREADTDNAPPADPLEKLRAAQERARKRARGEE